MRLPSLSKSKSEVFGQSGHCSARLLASLCAKRRLMQCSKRRRYSITSAAQPTSVMNNSRRLLIQLLRRQC
jgi:hypothetical protein